MRKIHFFISFCTIFVISIFCDDFVFGYQTGVAEQQANQTVCSKKVECTQEKEKNQKKERKNQKVYLKTLSTQIATTQKLLQQLEYATRNTLLTKEKKDLEALIAKGKAILHQQYSLFETIKQNQDPNEEIRINDSLWELSTETRKRGKNVLEEVRLIKKAIQQKSSKK